MTEQQQLLMEKVELELKRHDPCLMSILNKNNQIFKSHLKVVPRRKNRRECNCPEAPHNTNQFLTHKRKVKDKLEDDVVNAEEERQEFSIDNFIITGGSMKGIIRNLIPFI